MPKFSIITPTWNRMEGGKLPRCIRSVQCQTFDDYEHIVVDDGSKDDTEIFVGCEAVFDDHIRYIKQKHQGRVIARNTGMKAAEGTWIAHLDSDDCFNPEYLNTFHHHIEQDSETSVWLCGSVYHGMVKDEKGRHLYPKWTKLRRVWMPKLNPEAADDNDEPKTLHYTSGHFGTGMYIFRKSCLDVIGYMPDFLNHNQLADGADEYLGYVTSYNSRTKLCGNPHGEDWLLSRKLTMYFVPKAIDVCIYTQFVR